MNINKIVSVMALLVFGLSLAQAASYPTKFTNRGTVDNTRHNMTFRPGDGTGPDMPWWMDVGRNDYSQVCAYCHTPHGANNSAAATGAPLWNRTMLATAYTNYSSGTLEGVVNAPGIQSRTCLSCHDGTTAIDSVINMPGSGRYNAAQMTSQSTAFLDTWVGPLGYGHQSLGPDPQCLHCHMGDLPADDLRVAAMGTDMRDDHPVGIAYPTATGLGTEFNTPGSVKNSISYFDLDGNGKLGGGDVRLYGTQVECASCHDPHGVPSAGPGSQFKPTFLRVANSNSTLCLVCHIK